MRTYRMITTPRGEKGTTICEFQGDVGTAVLTLPPGIFPPVVFDTVSQLQQTYDKGRSDRSREILGDAGLQRATDEVSEHEAEVHMSGLTCSCGRYEPDPECDTEKWNAHLAQEILLAAARLP